MADEIKTGVQEPVAATAQTNGQEPVVGNNADTDNNEGVSTASFDDTPDGGEKGAEGEAPQKPKQSGQKNAEFARKRREAERARELKEVREKAIIEALGGKNPYTGRPMADAVDVEEFLSMQEIEKKGGDPVADFSEHRKAKAREERQTKEREEQEAAWFRSDREAFSKKYPDVSLDELISDEDFADYADGKVGKKPLAEIYEGYLRQSARFEERARTRAAQAVANREASPGALGTAGSSDTGFYTPEQVDAMSKSEVKKNLDKINESMKHWK